VSLSWAAREASMRRGHRQAAGAENLRLDTRSLPNLRTNKVTRCGSLRGPEGQHAPCHHAVAAMLLHF